MGLTSQIQRRTIGGTAPISPFMPLKSVDFVANSIESGKIGGWLRAFGLTGGRIVRSLHQKTVYDERSLSCFAPLGCLRGPRNSTIPGFSLVS